MTRNGPKLFFNINYAKRFCQRFLSNFLTSLEAQTLVPDLNLSLRSSHYCIQLCNNGCQGVYKFHALWAISPILWKTSSGAHTNQSMRVHKALFHKFQFGYSDLPSIRIFVFLSVHLSAGPSILLLQTGR